MNSEGQIKRFILKAVSNAGLNPLPESALVSAIQIAFPHLRLPLGDIESIIKSCEESGWIAGTKDDIIGILWGMTPAGKIRLSTLP